jgi:hypothetical protein
MSYFPNQGQTTSARSQSIVPASDCPQFPTGNITSKYRTNCDTLPNGTDWTTTTATGDLLLLDGNSNGASYWSISKSPFQTGTETVIDGNALFDMPCELSLGLHRSQGALNQEFAVEFVDSATPAAPPAEVAISALSQATTTLTVTTSTAHGLVPGMSVGIYGCADSRFNYGAVVVASVLSSTQFTVTAGPGGTITSLTASPASLGSPMLYVRRRMGGSAEGTSLILEATSTTNASIYVRSNAGDAISSGTANGNQSATVSSTASNQSINSAGAYSFLPTSEFKLNFAVDRVQWHSGGADSATGTSSNVLRSSTCPDPNLSYKLRIRATNNKGMTVPVGITQSIVKSASATATVTFASPHGLTVDDYLVAYGASSSVNFPNITTPTKVTSVVSPTVITITWGSSGTATGYGGMMARAQGNAALTGIVTLYPVTISAANSLVSIVYSATFTGASIGDYVNLYGFRDSAGNDLLVDGVYRVQNISAATVTFEPIAGTTPPVTIGATSTIGGATIKRTDLRVSFIRIFDYIRERVEFTPRPTTDGAAGLPVNIATSATLTTNIAPSAAQGASTYHKLISAATTNATSVKTSAGTINSLHVSNTNATTNYYLKIVNKTSAPTVGTDVPVFTFLIPPAGLRTIDCGASGIRLSTGIAYCITANPADNDTTAIAANEVIVNLNYT